MRDVTALTTQKNLGLNSAAITFNLILSFVPILALAFTFFQVFGGLDGLLQTTILPRIERYFDPGTGALLSGYLKSFFGTIRTGPLGATALLTLLLTVISLLGAIERAFNEIREAPFERPLLSRLLNYWALITLTPFIIVISGAKSWEALSYLGQFLALDFGLHKGTNLHWLRSIAAFLFEMLGFAILYWTLPSRRVSPLSAFIGGLIAATGLESLQWLNSYATARLVNEASLVQLYGSVPLLLVVLLVWLRFIALTLLFGMVVTTAWNRVMNHRTGRETTLHAPKEHLIQVAEVFNLVVCAFSAGKKGPTREQISEEKSLSRAESQRILDWLGSLGLIWSYRSRLMTRWNPTQEGLKYFSAPELFCQHVLDVTVLEHDVTESDQDAYSFEEKVARLIAAAPAKTSEH